MYLITNRYFNNKFKEVFSLSILEGSHNILLGKNLQTSCIANNKRTVYPLDEIAVVKITFTKTT